jgi:hypothetical protein
MARLNSHVPRRQDILTEWNIRPPTALNVPAHKGSSNEARTGHDYELALNEHESLCFQNHFVIAKTLRGYYRGYNPRVSQGKDKLAGRAAHDTLA